MRYVENRNLVFNQADFGVRVVNGALEVPTTLFRVLEDGHCRGDLERALSLMESSPTFIGSWFSLDQGGVMQAMEGLLKHLDGLLDQAFLDFLRGRIDGSIKPRKVALGAKPVLD